MEKIVVIGSSNIDLIVTMDHFPNVGETIEGNTFQQAMGGKGANQAIAAKRAGGNVSFMTSVGDDLYGQSAMSYYNKEGLNVSSSLVNVDKSTGTALIWVDKNGENSIVIIPGANELLSPDYIVTNQEIIDNADILVLQMEIPYETVKTACKLAFQKGKKIILNVAPAYPVDEEILRSVHYLVVNENEAEVISGGKIEEVGTHGIAEMLLEKGVQNVILTLGKEGCIFKNSNDFLRIPAFTVKAKDSTGAGDTFCGALAAGISKGVELKDALLYASAAAALSVTKMGAQPSIPTEKEINEFLNTKSIN